ncbi:MAG: YraN family protein [Gammaproteobacteria bacterium]
MDVHRTKHSRAIGFATEAIACDYLTKQGLRLITKNFICKLGEIDLIMEDKMNLVFVEVRYRRNNYYGDSQETVDYNKQQRLIRTSSYYLQKNKAYLKRNVRFDVIALTLLNKKMHIEWFQNAFDLNSSILWI